MQFKRKREKLINKLSFYISYSKRLVENIRLTLLSNQLNHFDYTYKLYKFEVDETATPKYDEILNKEDNFSFPSFDQEWQASEVREVQQIYSSIGLNFQYILDRKTTYFRTQQQLSS